MYEQVETPGSEKFRENRDHVKTKVERFIREKCEEVAADEDFESDKIGLRTRKIYVLLGIPKSSFYNYGPHLILEEEYDCISYTEQKGLEIHVSDFLEASS